MNLINSIDDALTRFSYLKKIKIERNISGNECSDYSVEIVLCEYPNYSDEEYKLVFHGVRDLHIGNIENLFRVNLRIENISDWQIENVRYKVVEEENDLFSFLCKEIHFQ